MQVPITFSNYTRLELDSPLSSVARRQTDQLPGEDGASNPPPCGRHTRGMDTFDKENTASQHTTSTATASLTSRREGLPIHRQTDLNLDSMDTTSLSDQEQHLRANVPVEEGESRIMPATYDPTSISETVAESDDTVSKILKMACAEAAMSARR